MVTEGSLPPGRPVLVLAHGAGAGRGRPWMQKTSRGLHERGISVVTFNFPYMEAGRRLPDRAPVLEEAFKSTWQSLLELNPGITPFAGGKSMGGRIATQAAAKGLLQPPPLGIICFGYPLHPPGKPDTRRDGHLASVSSPLLFIHGTRDPFGTPDEMTELVARLPSSTLHLVGGGDHSLQKSTSKREPNERFLAGPLDRAAEWIRRLL